MKNPVQQFTEFTGRDIPSEYEKEKENNERVFNEMVQRVRPEIFVLMDLLDATGVNPFILYKVIRQLHNLAIGSKWGQVVVLVNNGKAVKVEGVDTEKMNDDVLLKRER